MAWFWKKDVSYQNLYNPDELFLALINRKHWKKLNTDIIKQIFKNAQNKIVFNHPNEGIEVLKHFITISERFNLVKKNFLLITHSEKDLGMILGLFSTTLYKLGSQLAKMLNPAETDETIRELMMQADMAFTSSILCCEFMLESYAGMAFLYNYVVKNKDASLEFCAKYKAAEKRLSRKPDNELGYFERAIKETLNPNERQRTLNEMKQYAPELLTYGLGADEISFHDRILQLEKELLDR